MDGSCWHRQPEDIVTVDARLRHIAMLVPKLREADLREIEGWGHKPRHLLFRLVRTSHIRRTVFVKGAIAAMWGCGGAAVGAVGEAWLLTTAEVEQVPIGFLKTARAGIEDMLRDRRTLVSSVAEDYDKSIRLMKLLGFTVGESVTMGPSGVRYLSLRLDR